LRRPMQRPAAGGGGAFGPPECLAQIGRE
jgi:hypothetical protein